MPERSQAGPVRRRARPWRSGMTPPAGSPLTARSRRQGRQVISSLPARDAEPPRVVRKNCAEGRKNGSRLAGIICLSRNRHRHGDPGRQHRERDDQAERQRADRERGRDGVDQSGRSDWRGAAVKARRAGRPDHGRNPLKRGQITRDPAISSDRRQYCGGGPSNMAKMARQSPLRLCPLFSAIQASAATPAASATSASGRQSMGTKPGVCSTRRSQARIAGKVARS